MEKRLKLFINTSGAVLGALSLKIVLQADSEALEKQCVISCNINMYYQNVMTVVRN